MKLAWASRLQDSNEKTVRRSDDGAWMGKSAESENKDYSYRCMWTILKMAGKKQNMAPMWKKWMKNVDLDEPTSFLDHVNFGCNQRNCNPNELIFEEYRTCSDH